MDATGTTATTTATVPVFIDWVRASFGTFGTVHTHLSFAKGKYNVPDESFDEFYERYYTALTTIEPETKLYFIEKISGQSFKFFIDIDVAPSVDAVLEIADTVSASHGSTEFLVTTCDGKYHVNFPGIVTDYTQAIAIVKGIPQRLAKLVDTSVYRTGLRMFGSIKVGGKSYTLLDGTPASSVSRETFAMTIIRIKGQVHSESVIPRKIQNQNQNADITEAARFLDTVVRVQIPEFKDDTDTRVTKVSKSNRKVYIGVSHRVCPFKDREHIRKESPIYVQISGNTASIRCHDEDCASQVYPVDGFEFSQDLFKKECPTLEKYVNGTPAYTPDTPELAPQLKKVLEESVNDSSNHYKVAQALFEIYNHTFRIDGLVNPEWYSFDRKWTPSTQMFINVSEDLPRYYKSILRLTTADPDFSLEDAMEKNKAIHALVSKLGNTAFKSSVLTQAHYLFKTFDPDFKTKLDSTPGLVGFENGVLDLAAFEFRDPRPDDYISMTTGIDYIEYSPDHEYTQAVYMFLSQILPVQDLREYTLKVLGRALLGRPDETFHIFTGASGANGKSTLINFLEETLGDYMVSADVALLTNKRADSSSASPDVIRFKGRRIFAFQEPETNDKLRTGILKQYTGGDTIIARELFKGPVSFKLQGTMIMCCNELPDVTSLDGGTWRRLRVVEFSSKFCDSPSKPNEYPIDHDLKRKLKLWRPYFMSILVHFLRRSVTEGLVPPECVLSATNKYKADNNKFDDFFKTELVDSMDTGTPIKILYDALIDWWSTNDRTRKVPGSKEFSRALRSRYGIETLFTDSTGNQMYGYRVKIKVVETPLFQEE
jgi:P4 family phage/plasmid primase-like protien